MKPTIRKEQMEELDLIYKNQGSELLRPCDIVNYARNKQTALHSYFEWDNKKCGEKYRLHQARMLVDVYVKVLPSMEKPSRVYVSLKSDRKEPGGGYREMIVVMKNKNLREELISEALSELILYQQKYRQLKEIGFAIQSAIDILQANKNHKPKKGKKVDVKEEEFEYV